MVAEVLLFATLSAAAGGFGYLYHVHRKEKKAFQEEQKALETRFREVLPRELRRVKPSEFHFGEFVSHCGISRDAADRIAEELYGQLAQSVVADGVITSDERKKLESLAQALNIDAARAATIESSAKSARYRSAVSTALLDGVVSPREAVELTQLRISLGMTASDALAATDDISRDAYITAIGAIVRGGPITPIVEERLRRLKESLLIRDSAAVRAIRPQALLLYRERFSFAVQDGEVVTDEEDKLAWLEREAGLSGGEVAPYRQRLERTRRLASFRRGHLPSVKSRKLLESGEICHLERQCTFQHQTKRGFGRFDGELLVTSKRITFISASRSFSYSPSRVVDIVVYSDALSIQLSTQRGTGMYFVDDPGELEAIIVGVVRKSKYLLSEGYSSSLTRQIPDDVKREVWARDGGRCCKCGAMDYLEFDHVIPHGRGGANTVANIQVLCRRCNLEKRDRI